ncbi:MAG: topoisomerase C-terminal repeat-containing protein [Acutalibacteraceae bacterium]
MISKSNVSMLLQNGQTSKIQGFISKNGKPFDAVLKLDNNKIVFSFD